MPKNKWKVQVRVARKRAWHSLPNSYVTRAAARRHAVVLRDNGFWLSAGFGPENYYGFYGFGNTRVVRVK